MAVSHNRAHPATAFALLACALAYAAAAILARSLGFHAISDDDYARVAIAESFALHPALDPSGTSWLPAPFWLSGALLRVTRGSLETARAGAIIAASASAITLFAAARAVGLRPGRAAFAALLPLSIPLLFVLTAATVPELPTAALVTYALFAYDAKGCRSCACALLLACLSRYEAWPVAGYVSVLWLVSASRRHRSPAPWPLEPIACAALAAAGPLLWIAWNAYAHGDALAFSHRVSAYRVALGSAYAGTAFTYARAVMTDGGAIVVPAAIAVVVGGREAWRRCGVAIGGAVVLVTGLMFAEARGGAPTHHPERAVLAVWMTAALLLIAEAPNVFQRLQRRATAEGIIALVCLAYGVGRVPPLWSQLCPDRSREITLGKWLAEHTRAGEPVLLAPGSYAYFATMAAMGRPGDIRALVPHGVDPRSIAEDPFARSDVLRAVVAQQGARWVVAQGASQQGIAEATYGKSYYRVDDSAVFRAAIP